jgi:FAD binding domain/Berberine and berberine like
MSDEHAAAKDIQDVYREIRAHFKGRLLRPDDADYGRSAPIWNGMFQRRPGIIARCSNVADIQTCLRAATASEVVTAVRCGGHSLAGLSTCDDGLVIDLSAFREVRVDSSARKARFGGGCLLGTVDSATQREGLAFPAGVVSHTGAGGLVLGGGTGWLNRLYGLSCDNVEGFSLITADGSLLRANARENPDLFWALRGGGGNFGIVTEFEVRLHPVTGVIFGRGLCLGDAIVRLLPHWREFMPDAPDNLRWGFSLRNSDGGTTLPGAKRVPVASTSVLWVGDRGQGLNCVNHALTAAEHRDVSVQEMSFLTLQTLADSDFPHGRRYYTKSGYFRELGDDAIHKMIDSLASMPSRFSEIELAYLGGVPARVPADETAFGDRSAPFVVNILSNWTAPDEDEANIAWTRDLFLRLRPAMVPGVYVNFMSGDEDDRVPEAYRNRWDRLRAIKTAYDPHNFFRLNQNIPPRRQP